MSASLHLRMAALLAFSTSAAMAYVPILRATHLTRSVLANHPVESPRAYPARVQGRGVRMNSAERTTVELDGETVKEIAVAASKPTDEPRRAKAARVDAALAELARTGDPASAAAVGGFASSSSLEHPAEEFAEDAVPVWLSVAPPVVGGFSVVLFVLNTFGIFGEGPDLSTLVG